MHQLFRGLNDSILSFFIILGSAKLSCSLACASYQRLLMITHFLSGSEDKP